MSTLTNNKNIPGIHIAGWELMPSLLPASVAAGSCMCGDNKRYIYILISTSSFWRIDTWSGVCEQLANLSGTVGAGSNMFYTSSISSVSPDNILSGSIFAFIANGPVAPSLQKYNIATNTWSSLNASAPLSSTYGGDSSLCYLDPVDNNYNNTGIYHSSAINTITLNSAVVIGNTTISVTALTKPIAANVVLNFGDINSPKYVVVTTAAAIGATSLNILSSTYDIISGLSAYYYDHIYLIGNSTSTMFRYSIYNNSWSRSNASGTTIPNLPGSVGAGCGMKWLPGQGIISGVESKNSLIIIRGGNNSTIYRYKLDTNSFDTLSYVPSTETFNTGTSYATQVINDRKTYLIVQKDTTGKFFRFNFETLTKEPISYQDLVSNGTALVGDKSCIINHKGVNMLYCIPSSTNIILRTAILF